MTFASPTPLHEQSEDSTALGAVRARQSQTLAEIVRFQRVARRETDRAVLQGLVEEIIGRLRSLFAEEERYLRAISHPNYFAHCQAHQRLRAELAAECAALGRSDGLPNAQIAHLFDSYLIHHATTADFRLPEFSRNLRSLARSAFAAMVPAETALAAPGVRALESMGIAQ